MSIRYRSWPLAAGALLGVAVAAAGLVKSPETAPPPDDAVAVVNGQPIRRDDYERALSALSAERRSGKLDPELTRHVLDRLIDEELLIQAALELGLAARDRRVRADLSTAAIGFVVDSPAEREPSSEDLRAFFDEHAATFATDALLSVEEVYVRADQAEADLPKVLSMRERWSHGQPVSGDPPPLPLPRGPLPQKKLAHYLGPSAAEAIAALPAGGVSEPVRSEGGYHLYRLVERRGGSVPRFEDVQREVKLAYERWAGEERLRRFLRERRARASLSFAPGLGT